MFILKRILLVGATWPEELPPLFGLGLEGDLTFVIKVSLLLD